MNCPHCGKEILVNGFKSPYVRQGKPYSTAKRRQPRSEDQIQRDFWARTDRIPDHLLKEKGECCNWIAGTDKDGYGTFRAFGLNRAHRVSFFLHNRIGPQGKFVCHTCDNPSCVNPYHLFLDSAQGNVSDAVSKKRHPHGESHGRSILSTAKVLEIKHRATWGNYPRLAKEFGVSVHTVHGYAQNTARKNG